MKALLFFSISKSWPPFLSCSRSLHAVEREGSAAVRYRGSVSQRALSKGPRVSGSPTGCSEGGPQQEQGWRAELCS